jgi:hypothetical protein
MSIPSENARLLVQTMRSSKLLNLISQSKAKQVLREVHEIPENFPTFTPDVDDRVTFIAYGLLAAGCSFIERGDIAEGHAQLHGAGDILEAAHRTEVANNPTSIMHCLIGAMAFYACGQYSRAFVLIGKVEESTPSAGIIASFLRKNRPLLISKLNDIFLAPSPQFGDSRQFDDWAITVCIARSLALANEHSISGDPELLIGVDVILRDAMAISEGASYPSYWWLARLLRLMLVSYGKSSLWSVLPPFFSPEGKEQVKSYVQLLSFMSSPVIELWESQKVALQLALNAQNRGGVINLRTSAGKTRVAELAILKTLRTDPNAKVLYLAPFRSLAFELERTFSKTLAPLGYSVSHLYGGSRFSGVDRELFDEGRITIATPEKAKAMFRAAPELFTAVKLVVIDEGHLLGDSERNIRNEMFLEHLRLLASGDAARILLLSAVLPNAEDLATWIGGASDALVKSNWKPSAERFGKLFWKDTGVSIEWLGGERCFNPHFIEFKDVPNERGGTRRFPESKTEAVAATAARLSKLGPVLIFAGQAQWVPSMTRAVLLSLGPDSSNHPWPEMEWRLLEAVCKEELGIDSLEIRAARVGVICHSSNLPPQVRITLEKIMAKVPAKIIVATTTLGQGVNIGISAVIVATPFIGNRLKISKRDFWNICGRAGRAFVDGEGKMLFAIDGTRSAGQVRKNEALAASYFDIAQLDKVRSGLLQVINKIYLFAAKERISFATLLELLANDNFDCCGAEKGNIKGCLDLIDDQLLALHVAYKEDELALSVDWVDDAFRDSLAVIQGRAASIFVNDVQLINFLKARVAGVQRIVPSSEARRSIISAGLPLSVGIVAFNQLNVFREMVDRYLVTEDDRESLLRFVSEFETWARLHAKQIVKEMPEQELLDRIRPQWIGGESLITICNTCGDTATDVCTELYDYQLPWLFHAVAQKLDILVEEDRINALAKVGLLVELGVPTEVAAKVFLSGVRSRVAAVELSQFLVNPDASVSEIRSALLDPNTVAELSTSLSASTLEWLHLLSAEHGDLPATPPECVIFSLPEIVPDSVSKLHVRKSQNSESIYLCSTDMSFKFEVSPTNDLPFDRFVNDPRLAFSREGNNWVQEFRDPRFQPALVL